jgi:hypothetical protein
MSDRLLYQRARDERWERQRDMAAHLNKVRKEVFGDGMRQLLFDMAAEKVRIHESNLARSLEHSEPATMLTGRMQMEIEAQAHDPYHQHEEYGQTPTRRTEMSEGPRFTIIAKDGQALIGNHFHTLTDSSVDVFRTTDPQAFVTYVKNKAEPQGGVRVFYKETEITAYPKNWPVIRELQPFAVCSLKESMQIDTLKRANAHQMGNAELEILLKRLREGLDSTGRLLLSSAKDLRFSKNIKFQRTKAANGDFCFNYTRENVTGTEQFAPPETISFTVPIFENVCFEKTFTFEFFFDYQEVGDKLATVFRIDSVNFDEDLRDATEEAIFQEIESLREVAMPGSLEVIKQDNSWHFKTNGVV